MKRFSGARLVILLVMLVASAVVFEWWIKPFSPFPFATSRPSLAQIVSLTHVGLPADTILIGSYMEQSQDTLLVAKLTMRNDAVTGFVNQLRNLGKVSHTDRFDIPNVFNGRDDVPTWWDPQSIRTFTSARILYGKAKFDTTNILISAGHQKSSVVYIYWFRP